MPIKVLTLILASLLVGRLVRRWRRREMSLRKAALWAGLWLGAAVVVSFPEATVDRLAARVGVETATGIDFVVYVAVGLAFYLLYRVFVRLDRIQRETTSLVRALALEEGSAERSEGAGRGRSPASDDRT